MIESCLTCAYIFRHTIFINYYYYGNIICLFKLTKYDFEISVQRPIQYNII